MIQHHIEGTLRERLASAQLLKHQLINSMSLIVRITLPWIVLWHFPTMRKERQIMQRIAQEAHANG